jgi:hypothetical protein
MAFDFKGIKRCGARCRTKGGAPCLGPAMKNGRCRMHGGVFSRLEKHGRATLRAKAERKNERKFLKAMKSINKKLEDTINNDPTENKKMHHLTAKEIANFFEILLSKCKQEGVYSVIETAETMGVNYDQVKEWAAVNVDWEYALEMSRCHCSYHAQTDWGFSKLSDDLGLKYCLENDDEFALQHQKSSDQ